MPSLRLKIDTTAPEQQCVRVKQNTVMPPLLISLGSKDEVLNAVCYFCLYRDYVVSLSSLAVFFCSSEPQKG